MSAGASIHCQSCGKNYLWKPELAGKKVKCRCGQVMTVPLQAGPSAPPAAPISRTSSVSPPAPASPTVPASPTGPASRTSPASQARPPVRPPPPMPHPPAIPHHPPAATHSPVETHSPERMPPTREVFDIAQDLAPRHAPPATPAHGSECPECGTAIEVQAVICTTCGLNFMTGQKMQTALGVEPVAPARPLNYQRTTPVQRDHAKQDLENAQGGPIWREIYLPAGLVVAGLGMQILGPLIVAKKPDLIAMLPEIGVGLAINLVLSFGGILLTAKIFDIAFGAIGPTILKTAAVCLLVPGISAVVAGLIGGDSEFVRGGIGSILSFPLGITLFKLLFDIELTEAFYLCIVISLVNDWARNFILAAIFAAQQG